MIGDGISIDFKFAKANFFDSARIEKQLDAKERKSLSKFGAFVQRRARSSLRRRDKSAPPGSPPSVHSTDSFNTLKNILFAYDGQSKTVVIGPVGRGGSAPNLQEFGGSTTINRQHPDKNGHVRGANIQTITIQIRPHPFMNPAGDYEREHSLPAMFKDAF
jgi:hypothetical protein